MGRRLPAETVYPLLTCCFALFTSLVISVSLIYQTQTAGLNPFQLVMVGTALEATAFVFEVPTGVVADLRSRRLSVLLGLTLMGVGFVLTGAFAIFWTIILAHVVLGIGQTFISGAQQAWVADEVGVEQVGKVYLRGAQTDQYGRLAGIPVGVGLGVISLRLPLIAGGLLLVLLAVFLAVVMTERGFKPAQREGKASLAMLGGGLASATREVRGRPLLVTLLVIMAFYGAASEGFGRLWVAHFYTNLGFPSFIDLKPVVWFGALRMAVSLISLVAVRELRLRLDTSSHQVVSRSLLVINSLQMASLAIFAVAGDFYLGALVYISAVVLSRMFDPLYLAWINQNIDSSVRATVISMGNQMDSLGQIGGGPALGALGSLGSVRLSMLGAAAALSPAIALYFRAFGQGQERAPLTAGSGGDS